MESKEFGIYFSKLRENSGFKSQRQLAMAANVSNATIARLEAGEQKPTPETLRILSRYLKNTTYEELMERAGYIEVRNKNEQKNDDLPPLLADLDPDLVKRFIEVMNNPLEDYFFHDILSASKEEREEIIREVLKVRKEQLKKK